MPESLFASVEMAPRDPILGLTEQYNNDPTPGKINLGVGVYLDDTGKIPVLECVAAAEQMLVGTGKPKGYLPIDGIAAYDRAVQELVFGADSEAVRGHRVATVQTLGGTGGLKLGADLLARMHPGAPLLISDPSWENHRALFTQAGFAVGTYPYYDAATRGVRFATMLAALQATAAGTIVVLHACCHNPTGCDLTLPQWEQVAAACTAGGLVPFLDMAYQGFGQGIAEDGAAVECFLRQGTSFLISTSFSKSFSLYGERAGALSVVCQNTEECGRVLSQLKTLVRTNYSSPPTFGAQIVATVLGTPELRRRWEAELAGMRDRIRAMRHALVAGLKAAGGKGKQGGDPDYITRQAGMFSYSGLSVAQMQRLRSEFGIYGLDSGRICVAAINSGNIDAVSRAMAAVM
ncbi:MAG: aspartate/tyrosine/aromatic aminotransferase [Pseudomonadota bacterium]|nr:aspartate/tyrosine/aromatic aminotransferase [Pseudomonadota bacterium]